MTCRLDVIDNFRYYSIQVYFRQHAIVGILRNTSIKVKAP